MSMAPETLRIVAAHPASQGPFVVINARDFDPALHVAYQDDQQPAQAEQQPAAEAPPKRRGRPPRNTTAPE
jgi:hypothetical protein